MVADNPESDIDARLKQVKLETAEIERDLKRRELERGQGLLRSIFANPAGVGALITLWVALASGIFGVISSKITSSSQEYLAKLSLRNGLMLEVARGGTIEAMAAKMSYLMSTCQLEDKEDGSLFQILIALDNMAGKQGNRLPRELMRSCRTITK